MNVLNAIMAVPEVCRVFGATANPVQVVEDEPARQERKNSCKELATTVMSYDRPCGAEILLQGRT